jgi:hypothetical protein
MYANSQKVQWILIALDVFRSPSFFLAFASATLFIPAVSAPPAPVISNECEKSLFALLSSRLPRLPSGAPTLRPTPTPVIPNGAGRLFLPLSLLRSKIPIRSEKGRPAQVRTAAPPSAVREENLSSSLVLIGLCRVGLRLSCGTGRTFCSKVNIRGAWLRSLLSLCYSEGETLDTPLIPLLQMPHSRNSRSGSPRFSTKLQLAAACQQ